LISVATLFSSFNSSALQDAAILRAEELLQTPHHMETAQIAELVCLQSERCLFTNADRCSHGQCIQHRRLYLKKQATVRPGVCAILTTILQRVCRASSVWSAACMWRAQILGTIGCPEKAHQWWLHAANAGNSQAQLHIGLCWYNNTTTFPDCGHKMLQAAAVHKSGTSHHRTTAVASLYLGFVVLDGIGECEPDDAMAQGCFYAAQAAAKACGDEHLEAEAKAALQNIQHYAIACLGNGRP